MTNQETKQENKPNESIVKVMPSRKLAERTRQSLFTRRMQNQQARFEEIEKRYFPSYQVQLLAGFLELPDVKFLTITEALECHSSDHGKANLQHILKCFINGQFDAIKTAKRLDSFVMQSKPMAWQLWRVFDFARYKQLAEFVEGFKCACLKEVIQRNRGYRGAADVYAESHGRFVAEAKAANYNNPNIRLTDDENPQEQRQHNSLFLRHYSEATAEPEVVYTQPVEDPLRNRSFFRQMDTSKDSI